MMIAVSQAESIGYLIGYIIGILLTITILLGIPTLFIISLIQSFKRKTKGWIVLCVFCGFLSMVPVSLIFYGFYRGVINRLEYSAPEHDIPPGGEIISQDGLFKLKIPNDWKTLKNLNEAASIQVGNLMKEQYLIVIVDMKEDFEGSLTEHVSITSQRIVTSANNAQISEPEYLYINGRQAIRYYITGTIGRAKVEYIQTTIEGQQAYYQILAWTLPSRFEDASGVFEQVVQSFQEIDL
jgi:hypothetical protein